MRAFIINSLDVVVWLLAALIALSGITFGVMLLSYGQMAGIAYMIGGVLYAIFLAGMFFIVIGIHENTKRTAIAVERMTAAR